MNHICNRPAKVDAVKISGKPTPPKNQATIAKMGLMYQNIDPQKTTPKYYTKKTK